MVKAFAIMESGCLRLTLQDTFCRKALIKLFMWLQKETETSNSAVGFLKGHFILRENFPERWTSDTESYQSMFQNWFPRGSADKVLRQSVNSGVKKETKTQQEELNFLKEALGIIV